MVVQVDRLISDFSGLVIKLMLSNATMKIEESTSPDKRRSRSKLIQWQERPQMRTEQNQIGSPNWNQLPEPEPEPISEPEPEPVSIIRNSSAMNESSSPLANRAGSQEVLVAFLVVRKPEHAISNILIPCYILSLLICIAYLVKPTEGERVSYLITIQEG